jgi:iron-sulfur cluster repair protein YtfE (RIC family)
MSNLNMLKIQHEEMLTLIQTIEAAAVNPTNNAAEIAHNINALSGKMKIHLMSEDRFLYPSLAQSENPVIKATAKQFSQEMGGLAEQFTLFVQRYNIPSKITEAQTAFLADSRNIFQTIRERMTREDRSLYPLLEN